MDKAKHLAVYDYGQGGVWLFLLARSPEEIARTYPELEVVAQHPAWLTGDQLRITEEKFTFDIDDEPKGWLETLVRSRKLDA